MDDVVKPYDGVINCDPGIFVSSSNPVTISINVERFREKFKHILCEEIQKWNYEIDPQPILDRLITCLKGE